ncbi:hypothetical protein CELD12_15730 [Cellulomonas sp. NTE-D12]|nr:hypothetical protein CELD12_15730 [Cellulomonas sp. NTE-D12]
MLWVSVAVAVAVVATASRAMRNAVQQARDVRRVVEDRRGRVPTSDPRDLDFLRPEEVAALTAAPVHARVRGTRCPDPWASGFDVADHLLPIYANKLRERSQAGVLATDVAILVAGSFVGVGVSDAVGSFSAHRVPGAGSVTVVVVGILVVMVASQVRTTYVALWRSAADRYRERAVSVQGRDETGARQRP